MFSKIAVLRFNQMTAAPFSDILGFSLGLERVVALTLSLKVMALALALGIVAFLASLPRSWNRVSAG